MNVAGQRLPPHPLDLALAELDPHAPPEDRLEVLWRWFEADTGTALSRPPTDIERATVNAWIRQERAAGSPPMFTRYARHLSTGIHPTTVDKAGRLAQTQCVACELLVRPDGSFPKHVNFPVDIEPWSRQSNSQHLAIQAEVRQKLLDRGWHQPWNESPMCVTIIALVPHKSRKKDVDNLVKGLLDSMQGVLYDDDHCIQCLTVRRIEYAGATGLYWVGARAVLPWDRDVVVDDTEPPHLA